MAKTLKVGRHFLLGQGVLMLCLGMALSALGSVMANPTLEGPGYAIAIVLTSLFLVIPGAYLVLLANRGRFHRPITTYLLAAAFSFVCWLSFWLIQSAPFDPPLLLVMLAGLHGLVWGLWYLRLAFHFKVYKRKAALLCVLGATTSFLGIVFATQPQLSRLGAVTAFACYAMFIGVQVLLTTGYLYRECAAEEQLQPAVSFEKN